MKSLSVIFTACLILSGCATTPQTVAPIQPARTSAVYAAPKDKVWPLIVSEVGMKMPVRAIEKDSGLISTDWITLPAGYNNRLSANWISEPGGLLATRDGLRMNMKIQAVEIESGKTSVTINCHYEAFENNVRKAWVVAESNGSVEAAILGAIERKLPAALAAPEITKEPSKSASDRLMDLKKLLDAGAISPQEYDAKRKALVDKL